MISRWINFILIVLVSAPFALAEKTPTMSSSARSVELGGTLASHLNPCPAAIVTDGEFGAPSDPASGVAVPFMVADNKKDPPPKVEDNKHKPPPPPPPAPKPKPKSKSKNDKDDKDDKDDRDDKDKGRH